MNTSSADPCPAGVHLQTGGTGLVWFSTNGTLATVVAVADDLLEFASEAPAESGALYWSGPALSDFFTVGEEVVIHESSGSTWSWSSVVGENHTAVVGLMTTTSSGFSLPTDIADIPHSGPSILVGSKQCETGSASVYRIQAHLGTDEIEIDSGATRHVGSWQVTNDRVHYAPPMNTGNGTSHGMGSFLVTAIRPNAASPD